MVCWPENRRASYQTQRQTQGPVTLAAMPVLRLAIASPLRQLFDYLPPKDIDKHKLAQIQPGVRVSVPFGSRTLCGVLIEVSDESEVDAEKLRHAIQVLEATPLISKPLIKLCHWAATYYKAPVGEILSAALPTALRQGQEYTPHTVKHWRLTTDGKGLPDGALKRAPRQASLLELLQARGSIEEQELRSLGVSAETRRQLAGKGLAEVFEEEPVSSAAAPIAGPALNSQQLEAVTSVSESFDAFACFLLQGITGSGKTEVYLNLIAQAMEQGKQSLVLVPEIGLTPQTVERFKQRFDATIVMLHSGMTDKARLLAWDAARTGRANIVIGTRSAIFCSLARPGLIVIDEEHDASFKQQDGLRYSARDLAVKRAQLERIPILLGSATPSLESFHNANAGRYHRLELTERAGLGKLPSYHIQDIRNSRLRAGMSEALITATAEELAKGNQILLFLNRRGFAPTLQCHDCGMIAQCRNCDARLTVHRTAGELRCHHCEFRRPVPSSCSDCGSKSLNSRGVGTEQAESTLRQLFKGFPVYRVDSDTMQARGAMEQLMSAVNSGEPCILLGTQMLTKGHHFPDVTLVGLLDTDAALFSSDFRGPEKMGQLLTQVGGRAGRAAKPGRVIVQTHYPDHPLLEILLEHGYADYAQRLLSERQQARLPPYGHLLLLRAEARTLSVAEDYLHQLRELASSNEGHGATIIGPLPSPMQRRAGRFRAQLLVLCPSRRSAQTAAESLVASAESLPASRRLRWSLDVDPIDML